MAITENLAGRRGPQVHKALKHELSKAGTYPRGACLAVPVPKFVLCVQKNDLANTLAVLDSEGSTLKHNYVKLMNVDPHYQR